MCLVPEQELVDGTVEALAYGKRSVSIVLSDGLVVEEVYGLAVGSYGSGELSAVVGLLVADGEEYPFVSGYGRCR